MDSYTPQSSPDVTRAHWLRSEGMVIFDALTHNHMKQIIAGCDENRLRSFAYAGRTPVPTDPYEQWDEATDIAFGVVNDLFSEYLPDEEVQLSIPEGLVKYSVVTDREENHRFLFRSVSDALRESLHTAANFPLALLTAASMRRTERGELPLAVTLQDMADVMRKDWFKQQVDIAAFTANGIWEGQATQRPNQHNGNMTKLVEVDFIEVDGEIRFAFTDRAQRRLIDGLRKRNSEYLKQWRDKPYHTDTTRSGSTSGCPARHAAPRFHDTEDDRRRLKELAYIFKTHPRYLLDERPQNAINWSIDQFAGLLEKIHQLKIVADAELV